MIKTKQIVVQKHELFKYHQCLIVVCKKTKWGFVRMNRVNVIAIKDQFLEEGMGSDNIVRKTIQPRKTLQ